jgi:acetolactate synthase I/II/III large subunit
MPTRTPKPPVQAEPVPTELVTGGMAIVEQLIANSVDTVFGLPGAQMYGLFDALQQRSDRIRTYGARHEQGCGYMAFGYARSTGRPGVYAVVPGPGLLNTTAALCTAHGCATPVLCITGQVPTQFLDRGRGHLHELKDQLGGLAGYTKWTARIERPADAPRVINEAFRQMLTGRPGAVVVEMAWDLFTARDHILALPAAMIEPALPPSPIEIQRAAKLVAAAKHPMIFTGSGAQHASAAVRALAEELDAPVTAMRGGRGVMPEDHELGLSSYAANQLWPSVDCAIGIGSRLEMPYMRWDNMMALNDKPSAPPHLIRIDIDPAELRRLVPHAGIVADAGDGATALLAAVRALRAKPAKAASVTARARLTTASADARAAYSKVQPQIAYLDVIRACLARDGIFITELSQMGFASYFGYPVYGPRTYITEGYQGTLGFGFPTGLGVKVAHPDKPVVSVTGDGGFMFAVQELATAAQENIALVTLVFNNHAFGNVLRDQQVGFGNRLIGSVLKNPDFLALAAAFDVEGHRVTSPEALRPVLTKALKAGKPVLIEVAVAQGSEASPWPFITPKKAPR